MAFQAIIDKPLRFASKASTKAQTVANYNTLFEAYRDGSPSLSKSGQRKLLEDILKAIERSVQAVDELTTPIAWLLAKFDAGQGGAVKPYSDAASEPDLRKIIPKLMGESQLPSQIDSILSLFLGFSDPIEKDAFVAAISGEEAFALLINVLRATNASRLDARLLVPGNKISALLGKGILGIDRRGRLIKQLRLAYNMPKFVHEASEIAAFVADFRAAIAALDVTWPLHQILSGAADILASDPESWDKRFRELYGLLAGFSAQVQTLRYSFPHLKSLWEKKSSDTMLNATDFASVAREFLSDWIKSLEPSEQAFVSLFDGSDADAASDFADENDRTLIKVVSKGASTAQPLAQFVPILYKALFSGVKKPFLFCVVGPDAVSD
eukprot:TRINITY_DN26_c0_g1_i1.p1 TRINITY_DN26_c0_g1~~TRINITY_DN26_c0_g1_i1.p1  ORF type:complete len:382 (+),score=101.29 TRINITY_DN26_c0_g1_i1:97-1242(+)